MKYVKWLGLVAVAAAAMMAFVGAGTASAETTACATTTEPCTSGYGVGTEVVASTIQTEDTKTPENNKHAVLTSPVGTIECNGTLKGKIETATTPSGKAEAGWNTCTNATVTTATNGTITIHHDPELLHGGIVTMRGFVIKVVAFGITCYYGGEVNGTLTPSTATTGAVIHITQEVSLINEGLHTSSSFCAKTGNIWHATYEVEKPNPLFITTGV